MMIRLLFFSVLFALLSPVRAAEPVVLYGGGRQLPAGWHVGGWRGLVSTIDTSTPAPGESASWRAEPENEELVTAWAGAKLTASPANALPIEPEAWETGCLNLRLKRSGWSGSKAADSLPLQVSLEVVLADGATANTRHVKIKPYVVHAEGGFSDWFIVSVPLAEIKLKEEKGSVTGICGLYLQYTASYPVLAALHVGRVDVGGPAPVGVADGDDASAGPEPTANLSRFRDLSQLKEPYLLPPGTRFDIDRHGNFTFEGRPRFITGVEMSTRLQTMSQSTSGYPEELKWIYEAPLNYANAQRLGIDSVGVYIPPVWQSAWDAAPAVATRVLEPGGDAPTAEKVLSELKLPVYVDFSLIPTLNGVLSRSKKIPEEAKNLFRINNHFSHYAMLAPAGRELYMAMYRSGAEMMQRTGAVPLYYELLNEPAYDDPSPYNRAAFAAAMEKKYGGIAALNKAWRTHYGSFAEIADFRSRVDHPALFVEWCKFMEEAVTGLCRDGIGTISAIDKNHPRFAVQIMGGDVYRVLPKTNVNIYELSRLTQVVSLPTGGGIQGSGAGGLSAPPAHTIETPWINHKFDGMVAGRFYLSIAEGKPLVDGESYFGGHTPSDGFWLHLARGVNATYIFAWEKRAWDWKPDTGPEGGRSNAQKFPYNALNPYAQPTDSLADIGVAKEEILGLDDLFVPRQNRSEPKIAVLLSYPTARYSQAVGTVEHNMIRNYGVALDFGHYDYAVIPEEQIPEGRLERYDALVIPGVSHVYKGTATAVHQWVKAGGTLILALETMQDGELGRPTGENGWLGLDLEGPADRGESAVLAGNFPRDPAVPGEITGRLHRPVREANGWSTLGTLEGKPALLARKIGKGQVYFINAKVGDYALTGLLGGLLRENRLKPEAELIRTDNGELEVNVEIHRFSAGKLTGYFLYNWDNYPKTFVFKSAALANGGALVDPLNNLAFDVNRGAATLWLPSGTKRVLVAGERDALAKRFGAFPVLDRQAVDVAVAEARAREKAMADAKGRRNGWQEGGFPNPRGKSDNA